jgi:adenosylhomocysteine nucleosidase
MRPAILISADAEWRGVLARFPGAQLWQSPFGDWFETSLESGQPAGFFFGGWGKISAAASAQWVMDHWRPSLIVNLGTCGGFKGRVQRGEVILAQGTLAYDIVEMMGDPQQALDFYTTRLDLTWLREPYPHPVRPAWMISADRDLQPADIPGLVAQFGAVAADWESAAIAWTARRNGLPCLILRGVTDLVDAEGDEAYGNIDLFRDAAEEMTARLIDALPAWLDCVDLP